VVLNQPGSETVNDSVKKRMSPTDWARRNFKGLLDPIAAVLIRWGLKPNTMTLAGLGLNLLGAAFLSQGWMTTGGLLVLLAGPFDGLDGTMARQLGQPTKFGAFVDSVTDRWSEMFIFLGLLYYYLRLDSPISGLACILVFVATMGSVMVSYTKARAESLGFDCNVGVLTRMERYLVLAPLLVVRQPYLALWIIAVLANVTALQRALYVRRQARRQA
jgi:CDP-diacylglycerol--glycerol-3-phosphate 3-phosphatidyltransferase